MEKNFKASLRIKCPYCEKEFKNSKEIITDEMEEHSFSMNEYATGKCSECGKKFDIKWFSGLIYMIENPEKDDCISTPTDGFFDAMQNIKNEMDKTEIKKSILAENLIIICDEYSKAIYERQEFIKRAINGLERMKILVGGKEKL